MSNGPEVIKLKQAVWVQANLQPAFTAKITAIEDGVFWINLPKEGNQILVLLKNQVVRVGFPHPKGFLQAETTVSILGEQKDKFYGLVLPSKFEESQERKFIRANHYTNVLFTAGNLKAQTALVNFSAGGLMVYLVPELEKIILSRQNIKATFTIENFPFNLDVKLSWKKQYDNIIFAGLQFQNVSASTQDALAMLSIRYTER